MRVLMLGWEFPPDISGGLGTACAGLVGGLAEHGVATTFVLPRASAATTCTSAEIIGLDRTPRTALGAPGPAALELLAVASPLAPYLSTSSYGARRSAVPEPEGAAERYHFSGGYGPHLLAEVVRYAEAVAAATSSRAFDVVHAHDWMTFPAGLLLRASSSRPLVAHVHSTEEDRSPLAPDPRIEEVERLGLLGADRVVCVSRYVADRVSARHGIPAERIAVVHNGAPLPVRRRRRRERDARAAPLVVFLGRFTSQKGPDAFLGAARLVVRRRADVRFVMAGAGDELPRIAERAAELGLARALSFTGFLHRAEVERLLARADVFVMPSVSEPFGLVALEALAQEVPVVLSRQSGVAEVIRSVLSIDCFDVEGMADRILALLDRPDLARELALSGRRELAKLTWGKSAGALLRVYRELGA